MKKIAILIPQFYLGGMPQVASKLIELLQNKYNITLILVNSNLKIRVNYYDANLVVLTGGKLKKMLKLWRIFNSERFTAVISFGLVDNFLNIIFNRISKTKVIITEHSTKSFENSIEPKKMNRLLFKLIIKYAYPFADSIVAVSEGIKYDLERNFSLRDVHRIYNPDNIDLASSQPLSVNDLALINKLKQNNNTILLNVGRITRPKGQLELVKSMRFLESSFHLILLGEGPDVDIVKETAHSLHLDNNIHIIGFRNNISSWMKIADVYVSLSWYEGFPTTFVEAANNRLPIISADIFSGPREILSDGLLSDYTKQLSYPCVFPIGILTERFDFRDSNVDYSYIEKKFAKSVNEFIPTKIDTVKNKLRIINNSEIRQQYIDLIEF